MGFKKPSKKAGSSGKFGSGIFDVVDTVDNSFLEYEVAWIKLRRGKLIKLSTGDSIVTMVRKVKEKAGGEPINELRFHGHGFPGYQGIAIGNKYDPNPLTALSSKHLGVIRPMLALLKDDFADDAKVNLLGCNVAEGSRGNRLLSGLAQIWGVPVTGGIQVQFAASPGASLSKESEKIALTHEGPTKTFHP